MMDCKERLLEVLDECGEAAVFYHDMNITAANERFARLFGKTAEECEGLSILDICHNDSTERIKDNIHRRKLGDHNVPMHYEAKFVTPDNPELSLVLTVLKLKKARDGILVIVREKAGQ
ncbi:MAG: PAS domain S-box protein [Candidatus Krumholzibacteriota bacterium]